MTAGSSAAQTTGESPDQCGHPGLQGDFQGKFRAGGIAVLSDDSVDAARTGTEEGRRKSGAQIKQAR
jgi:hypothetical protein